MTMDYGPDWPPAPTDVEVSAGRSFWFAFRLSMIGFALVFAAAVIVTDPGPPPPISFPMAPMWPTTQVHPTHVTPTPHAGHRRHR